MVSAIGAALGIARHLNCIYKNKENDMRPVIIAGNWKMNKTPSETKEFLSEIKGRFDGAKAKVFVFPPLPCIPAAVSELKGTDVIVGAQNFYYEDKGAFTGEVSADMLLDAGATSVIIGHSERRDIFFENDELINLKLKKALEKGLIPVLCCGESLKTREEGAAASHIEAQISKAFAGVSADDALKVIVAYEPIWAIGTGKTATSEQAEEICGIIRGTLAEVYGEEVSEEIPILYGGSMNAGNAQELIACENIDGGLIGSASLKSEFADIVDIAG